MRSFLIRWARGTAEVLRDTFIRLRVSEASVLASSLAFTTVLSLVPLLAVSLSVFQAFGGLDNLLRQVEPFLLQNLVAGAGAGVSKVLRQSVQRIHSGALGFGGAIGLLVVSTKLFLDLESAVMKVWDLKASRPLLKRLFIYWTIMFLGPLGLAAAIGVLGSKDVGLLAMVPKKTIGFGFTLVAFFGIYKGLPACRVSLRSAWWSALSAAAAILVMQDAYGWITRKILRYNKVYGSLASIPIFLVWLLILWQIFLIGVALSVCLNARFQTKPRPEMDPS